MKETLPVVKRAVAAVNDVGGRPSIRAGNGGLDANWMIRHGVPTVISGTGQTERTQQTNGSIATSTSEHVRWQ
jgi:tripeptide aminopeptidase